METDEGASSDKLAGTVLVDVGEYVAHARTPTPTPTHTHTHVFTISLTIPHLAFLTGQIEPLSGLESGLSGQYREGWGCGSREWKVLDSVNHSQMGQPLRRMREKVLFAEYR